MKDTTYKAYYVKQTWTLKDEYNDDVHLNCFCFKPTIIYYFGRKNIHSYSNMNVPYFKTESSAKKAIKSIEELQKTAYRNSFYNIVNTVEFQEYYK